jgi:hypothetical protein
MWNISGMVQGGGQALGAIAGGIMGKKAAEEQALIDAKNKLAADMIEESNATRQAAAFMASKYDKGNGLNISTLNPIQPETKTTIDPNAINQAITKAFATIIPSDPKVQNKTGAQPQAKPTGAVTASTDATKNPPVAAGGKAESEAQGGTLKLYPKFNTHNFKYINK